MRFPAAGVSKDIHPNGHSCTDGVSSRGVVTGKNCMKVLQYAKANQVRGAEGTSQRNLCKG